MNVQYSNSGELVFLPEWAVALNEYAELKVGAQLCTKDGRRTGNAHIIFHEVKTYDNWKGVVYHALTDTGNVMRLTEPEIYEMFHIGRFISDVDDVLSKFDRNKYFEKEPE